MFVHSGKLSCFEPFRSEMDLFTQSREVQTVENGRMTPTNGILEHMERSRKEDLADDTSPGHSCVWLKVWEIENLILTPMATTAATWNRAGDRTPPEEAVALGWLWCILPLMPLPYGSPDQTCCNEEADLGYRFLE
ncbi:hypothetical protein ACFL6S_14210 [Candidatus Poribacteria bacterium]